MWLTGSLGVKCELLIVACELLVLFLLVTWAPESLQMVIVAMKLKGAYSLEEKL